MPNVLPAIVPAHLPIYRSVGTWLGLFMAIYITFNAWRAFSNPVGFASYFGAALKHPDEVSFVYVYGIRCLFLGVLAGWLVTTRRIDALSILAFAAVVTTVGDAVLAHHSGAAIATVIRHILIGAFLATTGVLLRGVARQGFAA